MTPRKEGISVTRRLACYLLATFLVGLGIKAFPADDGYVRLARLSYLEGHVSLQYASDVNWSAASINMPLEPGDRIYTGREGRAEIEFDEGSVYRLAEDTDIEILSLNENLIQLRILTGLSSLEVSSGLDFEINTPSAAFNTLRKGAYRFEVGESGETAAIVRAGELEAANNEFVRRIQSGERLSIHLGGSPVLTQYNRRDSWDEWNDRRNADNWARASRDYLPDTVYIGISDLDRYGRWVQVESYGNAWIPFSVGVSWSPYSVGRWCYRPFYGWTWISYEPWGWLPFHYGRWYRSAAFGWCWLPGAAFSFNFWSPGLVAFYSGSGWVSWCPLGPGDYYNVKHYHYNHRIYGYQLAKLRGLDRRAAGNPFYRNDRGAFHTVTLDRFRNGNLHGEGLATRNGYVHLPSRRGSYVKDRLKIQPTSASYRAAPDRPAEGPRRSSMLPAVVRSNPGVRSENRGEFTRITNPRISSSPSGAARSRNEADTRRNSVESNSGVRVVRFGSGEGKSQSRRSVSGSNAAQASGRGTAPRYSWRSESPAESLQNNENSFRDVRPQNNVRSNSQRQSSERYNYVAPERNSAAPSVPAARPRIEQSRRPVNSPSTRSSIGERRYGGTSSSTRAPVMRENNTVRAPRRSGPSSQRNSVAPSIGTSSKGRAAGQSTRSSGRSSAGTSSGSSRGRAQQKSSSGSSGGGRNRR